jgi:hypothetical protein
LRHAPRRDGNDLYEVDYEKSCPENPSGLDELRIAGIVGADGIRPYRSRHGGTRTCAFQWVLEISDPETAERAARARLTSDYSVRRALRALEDAGLVRIELGPRGGMATAKVEWLPRTFLAAGSFAHADEEALAEIGALA